MTSFKVEPIRIARPSFEAMPSVEELVRLAEQTPWLILEIPVVETVGEDGNPSDGTKQTRERFASEIAPLLAEHKVSNGSFLPDRDSLIDARSQGAGSPVSRMARFSIRRVVSDLSLEAHQELLVAAAVEYRTLANALMRRLAKQLEVDASRFAANSSWHDQDQYGHLRNQEGADDADGEWTYFFHGRDCAFKNRLTNVCVEARLGVGPQCGEDFGVFDPGFFLNFINTGVPHRPNYLPLAEALGDWWENARLALHFLERRGVVRPLSPPDAHMGWVLVT